MFSTDYSQILNIVANGKSHFLKNLKRLCLVREPCLSAQAQGRQQNTSILTCTENGTWTRQQCDTKGNACWCVLEADGTEIVDTRWMISEVGVVRNCSDLDSELICV